MKSKRQELINSLNPFSPLTANLCLIISVTRIKVNYIYFVIVADALLNKLLLRRILVSLMFAALS